MSAPIHREITSQPFQQHISRKALKAIHEIKKTLEEESATAIQSLHTKLRGNANTYVNTIHYALCKSVPGQLGYGRYIGQRGSLETLQREVRGSLCAEYYYDADIVNCHPVTIPQMAKKEYNIDMPFLTKYAENRSYYLTLMKEKFGYCEDETKEIILKILYGGACPTKVKLSPQYEADIPSDFIQIKNEMVELSKRILNDEKHTALHNHLKTAKKSNLAGSITSWIVQTVERTLLNSMVYHFRQNGFIVDVLAYDGCQVRRHKDYILSDDTLREIEEKIHSDTGYSIALKLKPFSKLTFESTEDTSLLSEDVLIDDKYACVEFIHLMGEDMIKKDGVIWLYDAQTGLWSFGDEGILNAIQSHTDGLTFKQKGADGKIKTINYGGSSKNIKLMLFHLSALLKNVSSASYSLESSKKFLLFKDGMYDMENKIFTVGFDSICRSKFFTRRILRNFVGARNTTLEAEIKRIIFGNPYNNIEVGAYYQNCIARAIAGHIEDKAFLCIIGNTNCGKGIITALLMNAFNEYVGSYNPNVLKFNSRDGSDEAKRLAWYVDLIGCRMALGNEMRMDGKALDGNMMKALSSGGDLLQARQNFRDQMTIEMITTFFILLNDIPPIVPCDKALKNRMRSIPHTKSFVEKPQSECDEYEMESDPTLKEKIKTEEWVQAFFWIIMDAYGPKLPPPKEVLDESDDLYVVEDVKLKSILQEHYEFVPTTDTTNYVPSRSIIQYLNDNGIRMSDNKIGRELKKLGLVICAKTINKKTVKVYYGLKE